MKISIILQARTGSTRLPQKMTKPFYNGQSVLEIILERLKSEFGQENIIVATTDSPSDKAIVDICEKMDVKSFRGSENDVLQRFIDAASQEGTDKLIRVCADNVFLDLDALTSLIDILGNESYDYVSFITSKGKPSILTHYGFWAEGTTLDALKKVKELTNESLYHEHVTNYIHSHQNEFNCKFLPIPSFIEKHENLRLTLDTLEDFNIQKQIYSNLILAEKSITPATIIEYLKDKDEVYVQMKEIIKSNSK